MHETEKRLAMVEIPAFEILERFDIENASLLVAQFDPTFKLFNFVLEHPRLSRTMLGCPVEKLAISDVQNRINEDNQTKGASYAWCGSKKAKKAG